MGGLLGGICSLALYYAILPLWPIIGVLLLSLLVMYARLLLDAHTPLQVIAGYLLGLLCTLTPNLILYHA
jgi:membrane-associated phospholipid phosphatase